MIFIKAKSQTHETHYFPETCEVIYQAMNAFKGVALIKTSCVGYEMLDRKSIGNKKNV